MDSSRSVFIGASAANHSANLSRAIKGLDKHLEDSRRHVERLLLRLDFNGGLSKPRSDSTDILGGL
jgi:gamma-tubulin complex component 4